jgi:phosphatidylglycerol:prolipoprotein diacylglycerol transferase
VYPVVAHIEAFGGPIRTYPLLLAIAALAGIAVSIPRLRRMDGVRGAILIRLLLWSIFGAWLGGRIHYISNAGSYGWERTIGAGIGGVFGVGFHAGGAVLGMLLAGWIAARHYRIDVGQYGDAAVPGFGLGLAIGRFACFLNGCCTGTLCDHFWCVAFPEPTNVWHYHRYMRFVPFDATWSAPVHPLQLYFTAVGVLIMLLGYWLERRKRYEGQVALVALLVFSAANAFLEQFRGYAPMRRYWYGVPQLTWVALATMAVALLMLIYAELRRSRDDRVTPVGEVAT